MKVNNTDEVILHHFDILRLVLANRSWYFQGPYKQLPGRQEDII